MISEGVGRIFTLNKAHRVVNWSRNEDPLTADWKIFNCFNFLIHKKFRPVRVAFTVFCQ
jgi:hypothetical protein